MTNLYKLLKDFKEARSAATPYEETPESKCPECNLQTFGYRHWNGCKLLDKHKAYKELAANNSDKLIRIIEVMKCCLEKYEKSVLEIKGEIWHLGDAADEAIQQAEKIAGEV